LKIKIKFGSGAKASCASEGGTVQEFPARIRGACSAIVPILLTIVPILLKCCFMEEKP